MQGTTEKEALWLSVKISINYVFKILTRLSHYPWIFVCLALVVYEVLEQEGHIL